MSHKNRDERLDYFRERYRQRRASGSCWRCNSPSGDGSPLCAACRHRWQEHEQLRRAQAREEGLCTRCMKFKAEKGKNSCSWCAERWRKAYLKRKERHGRG